MDDFTGEDNIKLYVIIFSFIELFYVEAGDETKRGLVERLLNGLSGRDIIFDIWLCRTHLEPLMKQLKERKHLLSLCDAYFSSKLSKKSGITIVKDYEDVFKLFETIRSSNKADTNVWDLIQNKLN